MLRKLFMSLALVLAFTSVTVVAAIFAPAASAQGEPTCRIVFEEPVVIDDPPPASTVVPDFATDTDTDSASVVASANVVAVHSCADAEAYPGPFTNAPVTPSSPYSAPVGLSAPVAVPAAADPAPADAGLAHSGSETFVLAYLGTGLLAFGAVALGMRRGSSPADA